MTERKCCKPFSRGTILLLVWSALISFASWSVRVNVILLFPFPNQELNNFLSKGYVALLVLLPVTGWIGDSLLGRDIAESLFTLTFRRHILISAPGGKRYQCTPH